MWRIPQSRTAPTKSVRITSTYVENTYMWRATARISWDHLHIRGEYGNSMNSAWSMVGSPPHTWRILRLITNVNGISRITSTYVENTLSIQVNPAILWDHLHIRGEYLKTSFSLSWAKGSPPHVWRILPLTAFGLLLSRITSTCVENTWCVSYRPWCWQDHLHMCGEYLMTCRWRKKNWGSPPHVWRIQ